MTDKLPDDLWTSQDNTTYDAYQALRVQVFAKIRPKDNWKDPIDAWIDEADFAQCAEAATFFCGSPLEIVGRPLAGGGKVRVRGAGYYACIGA